MTGYGVKWIGIVMRGSGMYMRSYTSHDIDMSVTHDMDSSMILNDSIMILDE